MSVYVLLLFFILYYVLLPTGIISGDDYSLLHEIYSQLFKNMQNSQHCRTVYSLTPETLHTLREEITHMNSRIIITAGLGVPLSTGPFIILFDIWFLFYIILN